MVQRKMGTRPTYIACWSDRGRENCICYQYLANEKICNSTRCEGGRRVLRTALKERVCILAMAAEFEAMEGDRIGETLQSYSRSGNSESGRFAFIEGGDSDGAA